MSYLELSSLPVLSVFIRLFIPVRKSGLNDLAVLEQLLDSESDRSLHPLFLRANSWRFSVRTKARRPVGDQTDRMTPESKDVLETLF